MKFTKGIFLVVVFVIALIPAFSIGVYDDIGSGDYTYYTNKESPNIKIDITVISNPLYVEKAVLSIGSEKYEEEIGALIESGTQTFNYKVSQDLSQVEAKVYFELVVYDNVTGEKLKIQNLEQQPTKFKIVLDKTNPSLTSIGEGGLVDVTPQTSKIDLDFTKRIFRFEVVVNDEIKYEFVNSNFLSDYDDSISYDFLKLLSIGRNEVTISFYDLSENSNSKSFTIDYNYADCISEAGAVVEHNTQKELFSLSYVPFGESCESELRFCSNGELAGSSAFKYADCMQQAPQSCTLPDGNILEHGQSTYLYSNYFFRSNDLSSCDGSAVAKEFTCFNGKLNNTGYDYMNCQIIPQGACILDDGQKIEGNFYLEESDNHVFFNRGVIFENRTSLSCSEIDESSSILRTCDNTVFSGSDEFNRVSCQVVPEGSCLAGDDEYYDDGTTKFFYDIKEVAYGDNCADHKIERSCSNSSWSGDNSYNSLTCSENERNPCLDDINSAQCNSFMAGLVTKRDDSDLKYFYDNRFPSFFNNKIYVEDKIFTLKIETNGDALCYITPDLDSFNENFEAIVDFESTRLFETADSRTHIYDMNLNEFGNKYWIGCMKNTGVKAYLSEYLNIGKALVEFKLFNESTLEIDSNSIYPEEDSVITRQGFPSSLVTTSDAICEYEFDGETSTYGSSNFKNHDTDMQVDSNGMYDLSISCFNRIYDVVEEKIGFEIDDNRGINVVSYTPKVSTSEQTDVDITISEYPAKGCRYSFSGSKQNYSQYSPISFSQDSLKGSFSTAQLSEGENRIYIHCINELDFKSVDFIDLFYISTLPTINNVSFVNHNGLKKVYSDYASNLSNLEIMLDVSSNISIQGYNVTLSGINGTVVSFIKDSAQFTLSGNFENITDLQFQVLAEYDIRSEVYEKRLLFDLSSPVINIEQNGAMVSISCSDYESGCLNNTLYGFSQTPMCDPKQKYGEGIEIADEDQSYVCAKGYDKVGNIGMDSLKINKEDLFGIENDTNVSKNPLLNKTNTSEQNKSDNDEELYEDPFSTASEDIGSNESSSDYTYVVVGAIFLVLAASGGGGYYAYKRGYLNSQLEKLGIKKGGGKNNIGKNLKTQPVSKKPISAADENTRKISPFKKKDDMQSKKSTPTSKKSSYDEHLSKLKNFVDHTLDNRKDVFDSFSSTGKGKVKGYDDTLVKRNQKIKDSDEFDSVYESKKENKKADLQDESVDFKKQVEDFEEYYSKKKKK